MVTGVQTCALPISQQRLPCFTESWPSLLDLNAAPVLSFPARSTRLLACRLGVKATPLHDFYPPHMTAAFVAALQRFQRQLPGFVR